MRGPMNVTYVIPCRSCDARYASGLFVVQFRAGAKKCFFPDSRNFLEFIILSFYADNRRLDLNLHSTIH